MPFSRVTNLLRIAEFPRAGLEIASLVSASPWLNLSPRGDAHPVVVMPGFLADDNSTRVLRRFLSHLGYQVHPWAQGRNLGAGRLGGYEPLVNHVLRIYRETGSTVSLVGWSLGGVHAVAVADRAGYAIRQVITLGSPLNGPFSGIDSPITSIYSRTDGVVPWQRSVLQPAKLRDNIEVHSSHIGLGFNPAVLYAVADRLALADQSFEPFHRRGWRALTFPATNE